MTFSISKTRELCDAATEGPWNVDLTFDGWVLWSGETWLGELDGEQEANAAFIAHARTALPQALDEIERGRRLIEFIHGLVTPDQGESMNDMERVIFARTSAFLSRHKEGETTRLPSNVEVGVGSNVFTGCVRSGDGNGLTQIPLGFLIPPAGDKE